MSTARDRLAARQAGLVAALVDGAPVPDGFDPVRVQVQAAALVAKRAAYTRRRAAPPPSTWSRALRRLRTALGPGLREETGPEGRAS